MLDIPYYMTTGYHDKMVAAVIHEANRIYRLWCINNPEFSHRGRVQLIAHSLGSAIVVDILSDQPTRIRHDWDITKLPLKDLPVDHFAFDVHNLFMVGSPVGLFLFLKRSNLLPRRGRKKPGSEDLDVDGIPGVTGERGTYGCLAVDNVYNVAHIYDPVALCLNATVDVDYAATLTQAFVPSSSTSWFSAPSFWPLGTTMVNKRVNTTLEPSAVARLPSVVVPETPELTPEELAKRKAFLLNDNGQIDFFLQDSSGPLEFQYLAMLSAHMSYWNSHGFVRMLLTETGRRPGRNGTLVGMRAQQKGYVPSTK